MDYSFFDFLRLIGSLALFLYGMKIMSEGLQKFAGDSLRRILTAMTTNRVTGVLTGVLLAFARISGETAPLLFTALNNQFFSTNMNQPIANLPNVIYQFAMSPYSDWHDLAWAAALLITLTVLIANILARYISSRNS